MRAAINDALRAVLDLLIVLIGHAFALVHRRRILKYQERQDRLRDQYGVTKDTPIRTYGPAVEASIETFARSEPGTKLAPTTGSSFAPKRFAYPNRRIELVRRTFLVAYARACAALPLRRRSFYVFGALDEDESLAGMLVGEPELPSYLVGLFAPHRAHVHPALRALAKEYGAAATRLWVLTLANPGVAFAADPSALYAFLHELRRNWSACRWLCREFVQNPAAFPADVHRIADRIQSRGASARLAHVAASQKALGLSAFAPSLRVYVCRTGGYVKPFLERIATHLPPDRYRLIPTHSTSTAAIETLPHYEAGKTDFLPIADGVLYEFVTAADDDLPARILAPHQLEPGRMYAMIVSDGYGLVRYQTGDLFRCDGFVRGIPSLHFMRRRGLEHSFAGEELAATQVEAAYAILRADNDFLGDGTHLTCIPSRPTTDAPPHYKLASVATKIQPGSDLAAQFDAALRAQNPAYAAKRDAGLLGPPQLVAMTLRELGERVTSHGTQRGSELRFKFLPLFRRTWEEGL